MLDEIPYPKLQEWRAYADLEPFDEERKDIRVASIVKALWDIARDKKQHPREFDIKRFILPFGDSTAAATPTRNQTPQEQQNILRSLAASYALESKLKKERRERLGIRAPS